jgi:hypothetical protein
VHGEGPDQRQIFQRHVRGHSSAVRPAYEMNGSGVERRDESGEIVGVSRDAEVPAFVRTCVGTEIALGEGDEAISLRDPLPDRLPNPKVGKCSMDEDDRLAGALLQVG